nr:Uncharacterised protein [Streptococcus thermophilus]
MPSSFDIDTPRVSRFEFSAEELDLALSDVPEWVPCEYREFFEEYGDFYVPRMDWHSPEYPPNDPFSIQSGHEHVMHAAKWTGEDPEKWFAVASFVDGDYAVYHLKDDGTTEFGHYHFMDGEFINGPFPTMKDWMRTYVGDF